MRYKGAVNILAQILAVLLAVAYLVPIYMAIITSLKDPAEISFMRAWALPAKVSWEGYQVALQKFAPSLKNSFLLAISATLISAAAGSLNGYALSKYPIPGGKIIMPLIVFGMFIPYQSILVPLFQFMQKIRLYGGLPGLVLVHVVYGLPITTLLFRSFYQEIPNELLDAGNIDGAGFVGIFRHLIIPLSGPPFLVVCIWQFTQIWNEFLFAVTLTRPAAQPITVALANLAGGQAVSWNLPMAGSVLAALPTTIVYILLGRYFVRGLLAGALKG